jgi:hypothetical protein
MGLDASVASGEGGGPAGGMMQSPMAHDRGLPWGEGTGGLAWGGPRMEERKEGGGGGQRAAHAIGGPGGRQRSGTAEADVGLGDRS